MSYHIPSEQWAQVFEKTGGPVEYKKIPVQKPGPDEVLINIKYSGKVTRCDIFVLETENQTRCLPYRLAHTQR
jgi:propanol-preferring alcohol dehydrogenase